MKVCHSAALLKPSVGIVKQMEMEYESSQQLSLDWNVVLFLPYGYGLKSPIVVESKLVNSVKLDNLLYKMYAWLMLRVEYYFFLLKRKDDIILTRYGVHDIFQYFFMCLSSKQVFLVHHTMEEYELQVDGSFWGKMRCFAERIIGKMSIRKATGIIAVTDEIRKYELNRFFKDKSYVFPNGILVDSKHIYLKEYKDIYKILFVASDFKEWHGLDLILQSIKNSTRVDFELHVVGKVSKEDYDYVVNDDRVIFHGLQKNDYIYELSKTMHVALSSFALYRQNMQEACTLKVRECLAFGLPVYAGHKDVFDEKFPYYRKGEPIIDDIILYAEEMKDIEPCLIAEASTAYIDKRNLLGELYSYLTSME